jgi:hypothetical protein
MRGTKNVLTVPGAKAVSFTATRVRFRFWRSEPQTAHRFADRVVDGLVVESLQEAIQRLEVRHVHNPHPRRNSRYSLNRTSASRQVHAS